MRFSFEILRRDLTYASRSLRKAPAISIAAVVALALGIGATTAILSVVNAVLLRPLPYADADRLVVLLHDGRNPVAPANFIDWRAQTRSFTDVAAAEYWTPDLTGDENPEQITGLRVSAGMMRLLGVPPILGRAFSDDERRAGNDRVVMISYGLWQRRFSGDRNIVGKSLALNGHQFAIIGVMPASFQFAPFWATKAELWAPLSLDGRLTSRSGNSLRVFARLKPNVSLAQARDDIASVTGRLEREFPGTNRNVFVVPLKEKVVGNIRTPLLVLFVAVGFVLLTACANVAHMLLARADARRRELAVRTALGATRKRLIAQMLTESALLAATGGVAGLALAVWGIHALVGAGPAIIPRVAAVTVDGRVLLLSLGITAATAMAFGLLPALRAARVDLAGTFRDGDRASSDGRARVQLRGLLVASEFALALVLLIGTGLMIRTVAALQHVDPGFDPRGVLAMTVSTTGTPAADSSRHAQFYVDALARVKSLPGVASASYINHLPIAGDIWGFPFRLEGRPVPRPGESPTATYRVVFPRYFATMRLPMLSGRDIAETDRLGAPPVVVINEFMARTHWPNENAVGKRIAIGDSTWTTVVGVAKNAVRSNWSAPPEEEMYLSFYQQPRYLKGGYMTLVVRGECARSCDAAALAPSVRSAIRSIEHNAPISSVQTMSAVVSEATADQRFYLVLLASFAAIAILLAAVGIYGVMSYAVARRTHEIGIRIALGAESSSLLMIVVRQAMFVACIGAAAGLAMAFALTRLMRGVLFGVAPTDAMTFAGVTLVLFAVALIASLVPARRATLIDPLTALREN
jgi:putative ABC transport system permease protein